MRAMLGAAAMLMAIPAAAQTSLACHSDGTETGRAHEERLALPAGTKRITATVSQPESGGPDRLAIMLVGPGVEPDHYAGLVTGLVRPRPTGTDGSYVAGPTHLRGFDLNLVARANGVQAAPFPPGWLVVPSQFSMDLSLAKPGTLVARLTWTWNGQPRDITNEVAVGRGAFRALLLSCYFGDVTLSDIRFQ